MKFGLCASMALFFIAAQVAGLFATEPPQGGCAAGAGIAGGSAGAPIDACPSWPRDAWPPFDALPPLKRAPRIDPRWIPCYMQGTGNLDSVGR